MTHSHKTPRRGGGAAPASGALLLAAVLLVTGPGCDRQRDEVRSYSVPKETPPPAAAPEPAGLPSGEMAWDVPEGWTPIPNSNPMRFATLAAGEDDDRVEVAITQLAGAAGGIAANINRWRGQVGLPPAGEAELAADSLPIQARGARGVMVDLVGPEAAGVEPGPPRMLAAIFPSETHTWFIKTTAPAPAIEKHYAAFVELCESVRFAAGAATPEPAPAAASTPPAPLAWGELPEGWTAHERPQAMSVASFTVAGEAALTITPLGGDQDLLANVNRWRRQVGLGPVADLAETRSEPIEVAGDPGTLVDIAGPEQRTIAVVSTRGATTWFYKLTGPDALVASQRDAFAAFVRSIRFEGGSRE